MKKRNGTFIFLLLSFIILIISSCITNDDEEEMTAPTVYKGSDAYYISFNSLEGMKYANIFRNGEDGVINIGQVIPQDENNLPNSFNFEDPYQTKGKTYTYFVRYYNGAHYIYTGDSPNITSDLTSNEAVLSVTNGDSEDAAEIIFESDATKNRYILHLLSSLKVNQTAENWSVYLVITNGTDEKPFELCPIKDTNNAETPDLRLFLLSSFLGKQLKIPFILGVKESQSVKKDYTSFYWTNPLDVLLHTATWSEEDGDFILDENVGTFIVPTIADKTSNLDYAASTRSLISAGRGISLDVTPYNP